jgi:transposase
MLSRHDICDADWDRIKDLLPGRPGQHGGVGKDNRLFVNAIRYLAKTGVAWADLPAHFGKPNSLWQRYNRWCRNGVWERIAGALRDRDTEWLSVDSSCVRASVAAAGAKKKSTAPGAKRVRRWAAVGAGSAPRSTPR